jgi:hypothetical protein
MRLRRRNKAVMPSYLVRNLRSRQSVRIGQCCLDKGVSVMWRLRLIYRGRKPLARALVAIVCGLILLGSAAPALAADIQQGTTIIIGPEQVVNDDVYAFGSNIQILGTINGDLFAAGNTIAIGGTVTGGLFAAANTISVTGEVQQGVHAAGGTVTISGPVNQDAVLASGTFSLLPGARIGRDGVVGNWNS